MPASLLYDRHRGSTTQTTTTSFFEFFFLFFFFFFFYFFFFFSSRYIVYSNISSILVVYSITTGRNGGWCKTESRWIELGKVSLRWYLFTKNTVLDILYIRDPDQASIIIIIRDN